MGASMTNVPTVRHPTLFAIKGVKLQLVTFMALTEPQAQRLARLCWRTQEHVRKAKKGTTIQCMWLGGPEDLEPV